MEEKTEYDELKSAFLRYLDVLRGLGSHPEPLALGAVVTLIALLSRRDSMQTLSYDPRESGWRLRHIVDEFESEFLSSYGDLSNVYFIPFEHPELYRFLYNATSLCIEFDNEVLQLVDDIYQLPNSRSGEYVTPSSIAEVMTRLVDVSPEEKVLDPSMGSGALFNATQEYVRAPYSFWGGDKNSFNRVIVRLKALLSGLNDYQELPGSVFAFEKSLPQFDVVLSNPPIGKLPRNEARHRYYDALNGNVAQEMTLNFIELGLQHLKPGGRAAYLVPLGVLFSSGDAERIREIWIKREILKTVISLPPNLLVHTGLRCAILYFQNTRTHASVRLIKADDCFESGHRRKNTLSPENIKQILDWNTLEEKYSNVVDVNYEKLKNNNYCLVPNEYLMVKPSRATHLSERWVRLDDVADVYQGTTLSKVGDGGDPVIRGRDLRTDELDIDVLAKKDLSNHSKPIRRTKANDILLQRIGENPAAYLVKENEQGIAVEDTVFIIRFENIEADEIDIICQFINSDQVSSRISNARNYSVIPTQTLTSIRALEVPIAEKKIIDLVREMNNLEASLKKEYEKAREYKKALFDGYDASDISSSFEDARFTANALEAALKQKDDITYRVRTQYPFPLAFAYRNIYLEREYAGIYERQMKYGEQMLSFLSAVGICLCVKYSSESNKDNVVGVLEDYRSYIERGTSPGDLQNILQRTCKILANEELSIAQSFSQVWYKPGGKKESVFAKDSRDELVAKLNAYKHHRGPANKHERIIGSEKQATTLESMLTHIEFISDWDLIRIDGIDKRWRSSELEYSASLLKGDHPAFEQIQFNSEQNLSIDKLYIKCHSDYVCLYPLISLAYNPNTRHEEIFTIDKAINNSFSLKSFESGTSVVSKEVRSDFIYWLEQHVSEMS